MVLLTVIDGASAPATVLYETLFVDVFNVNAVVPTGPPSPDKYKSLENVAGPFTISVGLA